MVLPEAVGLPGGIVPSAGRTAVPSPAPTRIGRGPVHNAEEVERKIIELTNQARGGRKQLQADDGLREAARGHSADMLARDFFDHINPDGLGATERVALQHRRLVGMVGENIWQAEGQDASRPEELARKIVEGWLRSPGHRANIENDRYTHIGVGVSIAGSSVRATQNFAYIHAWTDQDVPPVASQGTPVALAARGLVGGVRAEHFDLFDVSRGLAVQGPADPGTATWQAGPGRYLVRFHFPAGMGRYVIYNGPMVEIR